jgi:catechol 2,3-dioxygenase-like lactoylglutathione lyase family enzyme
MFTHMVLGADDLGSARAFYDATLAVLGHKPGSFDNEDRLFYRTPEGVLGIVRPLDGAPASCGNGTTIGFRAGSTQLVDSWHAAGLANGGTACEDPPGIRRGAFGSLYLAYLRDPQGHKLCCAHRIDE